MGLKKDSNENYMKNKDEQKDIDSHGKNYISSDINCGLSRSRGSGRQNVDQNLNFSDIANSSQHPSGLNLSKIEKQIIRNYVIDLLGNDPINCYKDIINDNKFGSLRSISARLRISRPTLRMYISNWLKLLYGKKEVDDIIKLFWQEKSANQKEKIRFYEIIEKYIKLFPERTSLIPTRNKLLGSELRGILSKNTFKPWVIDYLVQNNGLDESYAIYDVIWGKNCAKRRKIEYDDIEDFVHQRSHGIAFVQTPKIDFESMFEYPTDRYIELSCGKGHKFPIRVRKLIYDFNWCPYCNERFCERVLGSYLGQFFKKDFKAQVTLNQAFGIDREKIIVRTIEIEGVKYVTRVFAGQLRYDHFCPNVCVAGNNGLNYTFAVAGEFDGFYHDERDLRKNPFCNSMGDFASIKARDSVKNEISCAEKVIVIRLKENDGFNQRKLMHNQKEVIQEIVMQFNEQVKDLFGFNDVRMKYDPYIRFDPLGEEEPYRIKGLLDAFW